MPIKKISISLPAGLYSALQQWAEREDSKPTSLATDIVAEAVREEVRQGRVTIEEVDKSFADESGERAKRYARALATGSSIDVADLAKLANDLGVEPAKLAEPLKRNKERITNEH